MADYYPVLTRAIAALDPNTAEARRAVYERARTAIVKQLRSYEPPLPESEITKERLALEEAVRRIESEARAAASPPPPPPPRAPAAPPPSSQGGPPPRAAAPSPRVAASEGLTKVHQAAAAAASLGAATATAHASAHTTRAAFEPAQPPRPASRIEPNFERPRVPGPVPERRVDPYAVDLPAGPDFDDPNPHLREPPEPREQRRRGPLIGAVAAVIAVLALGIGGYLARDQISDLLGAPEAAAPPAETGPKVADRVGESAPAEPAPSAPAPQPSQETAAAPSEPAPAPAPAAPQPDAAGLVAQRAILYDEAPDQQGGAASSGSVVWRTEPVPNNPSELQLVGEVTVPERRMKALLTLTRNLDPTLPASHVIEVSFDLPPDFANGGVGNVPGILFKTSEEVGGSALKGMSVKVTKNVFWIGLEATPADREQNMQNIRTRGWIDIPILYDNGRRGVLTIEKGPPGERAFESAFNAWDTTPAAGAKQQ